MNTLPLPEQTLDSPQTVAPPDSRWRRWLRFLGVRLVVYLTLYVLSIGPMFWTWYEGMYLDGPAWVVAFYTPLLYVCDRWEWLSWAVNTYINWWILG
ncbi:MAG: hypothetical protein KatS3mg113_0454 [Planctomycetaceae bacterium]|nr:MAG: hypothetical protein KatS3mg113_0454 [Planctomycetaceae bacterium]